MINFYFSIKTKTVENVRTTHHNLRRPSVGALRHRFSIEKTGNGPDTGPQNHDRGTTIPQEFSLISSIKFQDT